MKRPLIIFSTVLCGLYILLSSNAAGPATAGNGIRNGAPGSNGTCSACHGGGAGTTTAAIALKEKATGTAANGVYKPGVVYTVTISGNNASLAFFGFQVTAVKGTVQAGTFSNVGADKHIANVSGLQLVEHSTSLAKTNGQYEASFDWTAPVAGTGTVTFNGIINGVNKDNNTGGDKSSNTVALNLTEQTTTGIAENKYLKSLKVFPQPATDMLHISSEDLKEGRYTLTVYDLNGKALWQNDYRSKGRTMQTTVPLQRLAAGTYFLSIKGEEQLTRMFIKQ